MLSIAWSFAAVLFVDKNRNALEALRESNELTYGNKWRIFGAEFLVVLAMEIVMAILGAIFGGLDFSHWVLALGKGENASQLTYGNFISAVINFLLMAFVLFSVIKAINKAKNAVKKPAEEAPAAPTTKKCPYCFSEIDINATRCPHCTSELK